MMCEKHQAQYDKWLDYKPTRTVTLAYSSAYDSTTKGMVDRSRGKANETYALIRTQRAAIKKLCEERCNV